MPEGLPRVRIVGPGRAGRSFEAALLAAGAPPIEVIGRTDDLDGAASGAEVVILAVPDRVVAEVARSVAPVATTVVMHCSGSLGLEVLAPHERVASMHPLCTLPDPVLGALRLRAGAYFAVAGDHSATDLVLCLGGHPIVVAAADRAAYHAAACVAANHLVGLLGQVERIAAGIGLPLEAFLPLARGALDDVSMLGPRAALTGPAARGDLATIDRHREALDPGELAGYEAGVAACRQLLEPAAEASPSMSRT